MFTIDLLKQDGIPIKSKPEGIAIASATFTVPVIAAIVVLTIYLSSSVAISVNKSSIVKYEAKIDRLSDAIRLQKEFEQEKEGMECCLSEIASAIEKHTQWSPILETVVRNMPDSMVLLSLEVNQKSVQKKVPKKDDPHKMVDIRVPVETLLMSIGGPPHENCGRAVKQFRNSLLVSSELGHRLDDIRVSQKFDKLNGQEIVSYQMECIFKPKL